MGSILPSKGQNNPRVHSGSIKLRINGEWRDFAAPLTLATLVDELGMKPDRVAVELNLHIVPRELWSATTLADNDGLEIVHFVGGGIA
jgi:thiazole synthase